MTDDNKIDVSGIDDGEETPAPAPPPSSKKGGIKKLIIPFAAGGVIFLAAIFIPSLFKREPAPESAVETSTATSKTLDSTDVAHNKDHAVSHVNDSLPEEISDEQLMADLSFLEIDTVELMKELGFLGYESWDKADSAAKAVQDSADTINWLQAEMNRLAAEKAAIDSQRRELDSVNMRVTQGLDKIERAEDARLAALAKLYDSMKPEEVAKLFENLDDTIIVQILPRLKPVNAAKVLALMPPKRAAYISTQLISIAEE
jgi:hypothetical protein